MDALSLGKPGKEKWMLLIYDGGEGGTSEGRNGISGQIYFLQRAEESSRSPASGTNEMSLHINSPFMPCPFCSAKPKLIFIRFQFKCTWNWVLWEFRYLRMRLDWPVAIWQHQLSTRARISQEFQVKTPLALNLSKRSFFLIELNQLNVDVFIQSQMLSGMH